MEDRFTLSPGLRAVVERAREQARAGGELLVTPPVPFESELPAEAQAVLRDWVDSGDYDRVVAELTADDPDLKTL